MGSQRGIRLGHMVIEKKKSSKFLDDIKGLHYKNKNKNIIK